MPRDGKPRGDALTAALRLLSYRERSVSELAGRLRDKGFGDDDISEAVDRLGELGYLDDERYARGLVDSRIRNKHWGPAKITADLYKRGVPGDVARRVMAGIDRATEEETASRAMARWLKKNALARPLDRKSWERACRYLSSLGFSSGVVRDTAGGAGDEDG